MRHCPARGAREPLARREGPRPPLPGAGPQPPPLSPGPAPTPGVPRHPVTPGHRCSAVLMLYIRVFFSIVPKRIIFTTIYISRLKTYSYNITRFVHMNRKSDFGSLDCVLNSQFKKLKSF